jgi:hypothetical protein
MASTFASRVIAMNVRRLLFLSAGLGLVLPAGVAWSYPTTPCVTATATCRTLTFTDTDGSGVVRSAQAIIQIDTSVAGTDLYITLSNITPQDLKAPNEVLTSFFWNIKDSLGTYGADWTGTYATTKNTLATSPAFDSRLADMSVNPAGITQAPNVGGVDENIGGEWVYKNNNVPAGLGGTEMRSGVSTTGLGGTFGASDPLFCALMACNIDGSGFNEGASRFGITSLADNPINNGSSAQQPMAQDTILFKLHSNIDTTFDLTQAGSLIGAFQYGTKLSEPRFYAPEPSVLALLGLGALGLMFGGARPRRTR